MAEQKLVQENVMRKIKVAKLTLNVGAGTDQKRLDKAVILLKHITGIDPVKTVSDKRVPSWGVRPGLPIGCKINIRGSKAVELIPKLVDARDKRLPKNAFDNAGNVSFGILEYIDISGVKYHPDIGMMGFQVCITLERPGFRIKKRKIAKKKVPKKHRITKQDAMNFMKETFAVEVEE